MFRTAWAATAEPSRFGTSTVLASCDPPGGSLLCERVRVAWSVHVAKRHLIERLQATGVRADLDRLFSLASFQLGGGGLVDVRYPSRRGPWYSVYRRHDRDPRNATYLEAEVRGTLEEPEPGLKSRTVLKYCEAGECRAVRRFRTAVAAVAWVCIIGTTARRASRHMSAAAAPEHRLGRRHVALAEDATRGSAPQLAVKSRRVAWKNDEEIRAALRSASATQRLEGIEISERQNELCFRRLRGEVSDAEFRRLALELAELEAPEPKP